MHVSAAGDCWTGGPMFAAKHMNPGDVASFPLPCAEEDFDMEEFEDRYGLEELTRAYDTREGKWVGL